MTSPPSALNHSVRTTLGVTYYVCSPTLDEAKAAVPCAWLAGALLPSHWAHNDNLSEVGLALAPGEVIKHDDLLATVLELDTASLTHLALKRSP